MEVWPKNDELRKLLKHPQQKVGFQQTGSAEWPDDTFTYRRIQDGDVVLKDPKAVEKKTTDFKTAETKPFEKTEAPEKDAGKV